MFLVTCQSTNFFTLFHQSRIVKLQNRKYKLLLYYCYFFICFNFLQCWWKCMSAKPLWTGWDEELLGVSSGSKLFTYGTLLMISLSVKIYNKSLAITIYIIHVHMLQLKNKVSQWCSYFLLVIFNVQIQWGVTSLRLTLQSSKLQYWF